MAKIKLTSAAVFEMSTPEKGQVLIYDSALPGFGVRVTPSKKSYFAEARVAGRTRRVTIGSASVFTTDKARVEAKRILGQMATGHDVNAEKQEAKAKTIKLSEAWTGYIQNRTLKPSTLAEYERMFSNYLADWGTKELATITPAMVSKRFSTLTENNGKGAANGAFRVFRAVYNHARATSAKADGTYTLPENPVRRVSETKSWHKLSRRKTYVAAGDLPAWFAAIHALQVQADAVGD